MADPASAPLPVPPGLAIGDAVPDFDLPASDNRRVRLAGLLGKPFVLYFYPKADTSGCTQQARDFQAALDAAGSKAIPVLGISKDPLRAIDAFARKHDLRFPLVSDETGGLVEAFGAWVQKSMYGRSYMGIERSSFLVGADGQVAQAWRRVKVPGHVADVMQHVQLLR